jgi:RNA polymerase sigma-70 factor (ECF subfamily)
MRASRSQNNGTSHVLRPGSRSNAPRAGRPTSAACAELLTRIRSRDADAFRQLYATTAPWLLGLLMRIVGKRHEAEDVLQEVFSQIWTRAERFDPQRATPLAYLATITRTRAIDYIRRRARTPVLAADHDPMTPPNGAGIEQSEDEERARQALSTLPEDQRRLILLSFFSGLTHVQIAEQQSLPIGTVKTRIRQGILRLRDILNPSIARSAS